MAQTYCVETYGGAPLLVREECAEPHVTFLIPSLYLGMRAKEMARSLDRFEKTFADVRRDVRLLFDVRRSLTYARVHFTGSQRVRIGHSRLEVERVESTSPEAFSRHASYAV